MGLTRRGFATAATGLAALACARQSPAGDGRRVLIAGGGIAGLTAAHELLKRGFDPIIFEASGRTGGRMWTLREPFDDGLVVEAGAASLATTVIEQYVDEFGLETVPFPFGWDEGAPSLLDGELLPFNADASTSWSARLDDDEKALNYSQLVSRYRRGPVFELASNLEGETFPYPSLDRFDDMTMADFLRSQSASEAAVERLALGYLSGHGEGPESYSARSIIAETASFISRIGDRGAFQIVGGNDRLPQAIADSLGERIALNSPVRSIAHRSDGVTFSVETASGLQQVEGDFAICAAPFALVRDIAFPSGLNDRRRRAIADMPITSVTRVYLQFRERFWESAGRSPAAYSDDTLGQIFPSTIARPGATDRGVLEAFPGGERARRLAAMSEEDAITSIRTQFEMFHPESDAYFEKGRVFSWDKQPWQKGCQAYFRPGEIRELFPLLQSPEGRLHFAGDQIGGVPGYVFSAIDSAHRVAEAIAGA